MPYFSALKELGNIFIVSAQDSKSLAELANDMKRFNGVFTPDELYEFAQCREDWFKVKGEVNRLFYGFGVRECIIQ